ncbi:ABC transporter permease [Acidiphilium sp.]|uniref:ABC transporter permease n=1 Tax=Acidiphilium sp. TaxID=527 RepID=UPI00258EB2C8|nr:ABC transporter permease [Acidiphilium sp.]
MPAGQPALAAALPRFKIALPVAALAAMFGIIFWIRPEIFSYFGIGLLLDLAMPAVFASMAQMCVIAINDIDLGIGPFISLTSCIAATLLVRAPAAGLLALTAAIGAYALMGGLIHVRRLPSIVVTLGASFIWLGCALLLLPSPGGGAPSLIAGFVNLSPPLVPLPILVLAGAALLGHLLLMRTARGAVLRGIGGNAKAVEQAGWSLARGRMLLYGIAGACGVIAGLLLDGINTSGDATVGAQYTLTSIAAVIVGGGEFVGGDVSPVGTVTGTLIMLLTGSVLSFVNISTSWQLSVEGGILIVVLGLRALARSV